MATDDLEWLGTWYQQQCNGNWEHQKGMRLEPLRNRPRNGWKLRIELRGTTAAGSAPRRLTLCSIDGPSPKMWVRCTLNAQQFVGEAAEVEELIAVFRSWIGAQPPALEAASAG